MKRTAVLPLGLMFLLALQSSPSAQEKAEPAPIPSRYHAIQKTQRTRLLQVYGSPEVQPGFGQTGVYASTGKLAVFAGNVPAAEETDPLGSHLFVWDLEQGAFRKEIALQGRAVTALALSADGSQALLGLATVDAKSKQPAYSLAVWDLANGKEIRAFGNLKKPVFSLAISPDGTRALAGSSGSLTQWDLKLGKELAPVKIPDDKVVAAIAYLPGGKQALSGWADELRLWDLADGKEQRAYKSKKPGAVVLGLAVSADGKRFASADFDFSATLWETGTGKEIGAYRRENTALAATPAAAEVVLGDDGKTVFVCWGGFSPGAARDSAFVCRFDGATGKEVWSKSAALQGVVPMRLSETRLLLGGGANPFYVWEAADGKEARTWGGHKGQVTALVSVGTGAILSAGSEGVLFLSGGPRENQLNAWRGHDAAISAMAMRKDGKLLTGSADKTVKLHDVAKRTSLATLQGHTGNVTSVLFGDTDGWAASGSDDRTVILWDLKTGKKRHVLEGHAEGINAIALSPRGDWLASASNDNIIRLWPLKDGQPDADRESIVLDGHKRQVTCVAFSPDGKHLLSASQDQTLKLWDLAEQKVAREFKGHKNWISAAIFQGPDLIVTASDDLAVCLWDVWTAKEVDRIDLSTAADGPRSLVSLGPDQFAVGTSGWVVMRFAVNK